MIANARIVALFLSLMIVWSASPAGTQPFLNDQIIDEFGDGTNELNSPVALHVDADGRVYVVARLSDNAFMIDPSGEIEQIVDGLSTPIAIAADADGNVYVADASADNVVRITPTGAVSEAIGREDLAEPSALGVDADGNVYVADEIGDQVLKLTPGGVLSVLIDSTGDGLGNELNSPRTLAVDGAGAVYVAGYFSDNVLRASDTGEISHVGDIGSPIAIDVDDEGSVYVVRNNGPVYEISNTGEVTQILDASGDGLGNELDDPTAIVVDHYGRVCVTGQDSDNVFCADQSGLIVEIIDRSDDLNSPEDIAVDSSGNVYVAGRLSDNVIVVAVPEPGRGLLLAEGALLFATLALWRMRERGDRAHYPAG